MFRRSLVAWVVNACSLLRLSQSKTLAQIVFDAMKCRRVSQADIGRAMETGTTPKHNIKRVSRFIGNGRVNIADGCRGLVRIAAKASGGCVVVAVDWPERPAVPGSTSAGSRSSRPRCRSAVGLCRSSSWPIRSGS